MYLQATCTTAHSISDLRVKINTFHILAKVPDVQIEVNTSISHASAYEVEQNPTRYNVGIGHEFGLVCTTSRFFEVFWYRGDMMGKEQLQHVNAKCWYEMLK